MKDQIKVNGVLYRQQFRKCGKPGCKCNTGEGHGPYWYSYDGNSAAKYVGMKLPDHIMKHIESLKAGLPKIKKIRADLQKQRDNLYQQQRRVELQLRTVNNLEAGEFTASEVLKDLGLAQFNSVISKQ